MAKKEARKQDRARPSNSQACQGSRIDPVPPSYVKGGENVYHCGGGIMYHPHDEKELNWEPGGVRSGTGVRRSGLSQESSASSGAWEAALLSAFHRSSCPTMKP